MNTEKMKSEIAKIEAKMPTSKLKPCYGTSAGYASARTYIAALRFCGLREDARAFECNACGEEHAVSEAIPVNWHGGACLVSAGCIDEKMDRLA